MLKMPETNGDCIVDKSGDTWFVLPDSNQNGYLQISYNNGVIGFESLVLNLETKNRIEGFLKGTCNNIDYVVYDYTNMSNYIGYTNDIPSRGSEIKADIITISNFCCNGEINYQLNSRVIKCVEVKMNKDVYIIKDENNNTYLLKLLISKKVCLAIAEEKIIPTVGKKICVGVLVESKGICLDYKNPIFINVQEKEDVYICDSSGTRYIILKESKDNSQYYRVFGFCSYMPVTGEKLKAYELIKINHNFHLKQINLDVNNVVRWGKIYIVEVSNGTKYYFQHLKWF